MHRTQDDERTTTAPAQRTGPVDQGTARRRSPSAVVVDVGCEACGARATLSPQESLAWFGTHPYGCDTGDPSR